jgi:hypothetical protein
MKRKLVARIAALVAFAMVVQPLAQADELSIRLRRQNSPVWCWAAVSAMLVSYIQKFDAQDCEILSEYDMRLGGRGMCCAGAAECQRPGIGLEEMGVLLGRVFGIHGRYDYDPVDWDDLKDEIDAGRPVVALLAEGGMAAHVVVIAGYRSSGYLTVLDPAAGRYSEAYRSLVRGASEHGKWAGTLRLTSDPADDRGCTRRPDALGRARIVCENR